LNSDKVFEENYERGKEQTNALVDSCIDPWRALDVMDLIDRPRNCHKINALNALFGFSTMELILELPEEKEYVDVRCQVGEHDIFVCVEPGGDDDVKFLPFPEEWNGGQD
jgi:hypothetical protein